MGFHPPGFSLGEGGDSGDSGAGAKAGAGGDCGQRPPRRSSISGSALELQFSQDGAAQSSAFSFLRYLKAELVQRVD